MEENDPRLQKHGFANNTEEKETFHDDEESTTFKRELVHETFSREMKENGIDCEPLDIGTSIFESGVYSSRLFPLGSLGLTSRGVIRVNSHHFDCAQILQRG